MTINAMEEKITRIYLGMVAGGGIFAILYTFYSEALFSQFYKKATLSYLLTFLGGMIFISSIVILASYTMWASWMRKSIFESFSDLLKNIIKPKRPFMIIVFLFVFLALIAGQFSISPSYIEDDLQKCFLKVMKPFFLWFLFLCVASLIALVILTGKIDIFKSPKIIGFTLIFLGLIVGLIWVVNGLGIGFTEESKETGLFHTTSYPILGYQVFFAWGLSILGYGISTVFPHKENSGYKFPAHISFDLIACFVIFLGAFLLWNNVPLKLNWFIDIPRPPNFEHYPNSDAGLYARNAQNLMAQGEFVTIGRRPALSIFFAILHSLSGFGYEDIIPLLVGFFSLLPVMLYALGHLLHSRLAGFLAAFLYIFRHYNGLLLGDVVTGINVKMLMAEIPTTFGVILFVLLFVVWIKQPEKKLWLVFLSGAVLGLTMLVRSEVGLILPFMGLAILIKYKGSLWKTAKATLLISLGLILVLFPWVERNWYRTGRIFIEKPGMNNKIRNIFQDQDQTSSINTVATNSFMASSNEKFLVEEGSGVGVLAKMVNNHQIEDLVVEEPILKTRLIANHYANNFLSSLLYLPHTPLVLDMDFLSRLLNRDLERVYGGFFYSPEKYVRTLPYWWENWDGKIENHSLIGLGMTMALIFLGFYSLWRQERAVALAPFLVLLAIMTSYVLVRYSGGRFMQKGDWVTMFYYSIGIAELSLAGYRLWTGEKQLPLSVRQKKNESLAFRQSASWLLLLLPVGVLLLGATLPLTEMFLPEKYTHEELMERRTFLLEEYQPLLSYRDRKQLTEFLNNGGKAEAVYGRVLYPRYFEKGESLIDSDVSREYSRLNFYITGTRTSWADLPLQKPPSTIPNGSDAIIIGCGHSRTFQTLAIILFFENTNQVEKVYWRDGDREELITCPLPDPKE